MGIEEVIKKVRNLNEILCEETISDIVSALERGKKYEVMWNKSKKDLSRASVENWKVSLKQIILEIKKLEQKYFPKE